MVFSSFIRDIFLLKKDKSPTILTGSGFHAIIRKERARCDRNSHGFSVVIFQLGENVAESEEQLIINCLFSQIRVTDEIGWYDHEGIGVFLYNTSTQGAWQFADNIRVKIDAQKIPYACSVLTYPDDWIDTDNRYQGADDKSNAIINDSKPGNRQRLHSKKNDNSLAKNTPLKLPTPKRVLDVFGALLGLIFLSPLFLFLAGLIKIVSPGPVFFAQQRVGYGGNLFTIWKFRTMHINVDTSAHQKLLANYINNIEPMAKLDDDPQIIPFGNILRKTCLDELPQLLNVLRGEMSLVGPRPPVPYEVEVYKHWHKGRLNTLPGMTGLWQVSGKNRLTFKEMVQLDIRYVQKISLRLDLKILALTPVAIWGQVKDSLYKNLGET